MENKTTLVVGASEKPDRYSYKAIRALRAQGHEVIAFGLRPGQVADVPFQTTWDPTWRVDTVTLYINPQVQAAYQQDILALKPKRILFNPGTENPVFAAQLREAGIETEEACTLVLLSIQQY